MTYASPIITSVNSGELSPRMAARVDFDRYKNGAARARNVILLPTGGFTRAPGSRFINAIKDETKVGRMLPFRFSQTDAYMIEMAENAVRFYRRQARIDAANVTSSITNGTFAANITNWSDVGAGTPTWDSGGGGRLALPAVTSVYSAAEQSVATSTTSVEHVIQFQIIGDLGGKVRVVVGSASNTANLFPETELGIGYHTIAFTPVASPYYLGFRNYLNEIMYIDNVSVIDNAPVELVHDYSESELQDLRILQTADVLYLYHPDNPTRKIERRGDRVWSIVTVPWQDGPYNDQNENFDVTLTQLIKNPDFSDAIRYWTDVSSTDANVDYDGSQKIVVLTSGDDSNEDAAIEQQVTTGASGSEVFVLHFRFLGENSGAIRHILQIGTTAGATDVLAATSYEQGWQSIKITSSQATFFIRLRRPPRGGADQPLVAGGVGGCYLYRQDSRLLELSGTEGSVTCAAYGFTPFALTDVGRSIRFTWPGKEPAWGIITAFSSSSSVTVRLRRKAPYASVPTENWQLGSWSETNGYATVATLFQSRQVVANSELKPNTLWFTQSGDLENLRPDSFLAAVSTTEDDDALTYIIASEEVNSISWMAGQRKLLIGTAGGEFVAESQGAAITATDISITQHADVFCAQAAPVATESAIVFLEGSGMQVHDLGFQLEQDAFVSADLTILADHMLSSPAQEIVMQRRPLQSVWARRDDGRLGVLGYNRRQDIVGWTHRIMGGAFSTGLPVVESIAVIPGSPDTSQVNPSGERDEIWLMVKRTINSTTHRYIEVMEGYFRGPVREDYATEALWEAAVKTAQGDAFYVDCGFTYEGVATASITGLSHLEGQSVSILADGKVHTPKTVSSGAITLDYTATKVQVGLAIPWSFESLKLPFGTQSGSGVNKIKSIPAVGLALHDAGVFSYGLVIYDEEEGRVVKDLTEIDFLRDGLNMDEAIPLFTGEVIRNLEGATRRDVRVYMEGDDPLPFTLLAIVPQILSQER